MMPTDGGIVVSGKSRFNRRPSPEYAAMEARWGPPFFWRGYKLKTAGARDDAAAVAAWAEFDGIHDPRCPPGRAFY